MALELGLPFCFILPHFAVTDRTCVPTGDAASQRFADRRLFGRRHPLAGPGLVDFPNARILPQQVHPACRSSACRDTLQSDGCRRGIHVPFKLLNLCRVRILPNPEVDPLNYTPRVKLPVLMLNGRYDLVFPLESSVRPLFERLGTPPSDKVLRVYESDHMVPRAEMIRESLAWLDKYLGPVEPTTIAATRD